MLNNNGVIRTDWAQTHELLTKYYDEEWGMPVFDEQEIFERLSLEVFQSGLSWLTILKRREAFREAFKKFDVDQVCLFDEEEVAELLENEKIIRNERKIRSVINNAQAAKNLRDKGGLKELVWSFMPETSPATDDSRRIPSSSKESEELARALKREGFKFVGPVMTYAAMGAIGVVDLHIVSSHRRGCSGLWNKDGTRTQTTFSVIS